VRSSFFCRNQNPRLQNPAVTIKFGVVKILDRYIIREFIPPFLLGLLLFTFVLLTNRIFKLTELIVNRGVSIFDVLRLISYIMPSFLMLTIPMAVLLGALVAFGRLSTDSEVTALRASGLPFMRLAAPVLGMSVLAAMVTAYFSLYLAPEKARTFKHDLITMAKNRALVNIEEGVFNDSFKDLIIYAQKTPATNEMEGVFISDERNTKEPYVIIAQKGVVDVDPASGFAYLRLTQGTVQKKGNTPGSYQEISFDSNNLSINLYDRFFEDEGRKRVKAEMSLSELKDVAVLLTKNGQSNNFIMAEYYKRFTVPLACIVFGLMGPPLGLFSRRTGKSTGMTVALIVFGAYYLIMKGGENLANKNILDPLFAVLLPNLVVGAIAAATAATADTEGGLGTLYARLSRSLRHAGKSRERKRRLNS